MVVRVLDELWPLRRTWLSRVHYELGGGAGRWAWREDVYVRSTEGVLHRGSKQHVGRQSQARGRAGVGLWFGVDAAVWARFLRRELCRAAAR